MKYQSILLIDDDEDDREIFQNAITRLGRGVTYESFESARLALTGLLSGTLNPDLIFLDLNMPVMNGQEFLKKIKEDERLKEIPVIIFSTSNNFNNINDTMKMGAMDYITKPYTYDALVKILDKIL